MKQLLLVWMSLLACVSLAHATEMHYVIKVTPALVYIDVGKERGAQVGEVYLVLREDGDQWVEVGEAQLVRVSEGFSIGEITYVVEGEGVEMLQRAVSRRDWSAMGDAQQAPPRARGHMGKRSVFVFVGGDFGRNADLVWGGQTDPQPDVLASAKSSSGMGLGLRLGQVLGERWRLNLTYRAGLGADVTDLAIEADLHWLSRGYDRAGLYLGAGIGMHQMSLDPPGNSEDSANKMGFNGVIGVQIPGQWSVIVEGGYQKVLKWGDMIDLSNVRTYVGVGRMF